MPINDFICKNCGHGKKNVLHKHSEEVACGDCGQVMEVFFGDWETLAFRRPFSQSMYNATDTGLNSFGALHDPVTKAELGITKDKKHTLLSNEERVDFGKRLLKEGDSPQLRKDIKSRREQVLKEKKSSRTEKKYK